MAMKPHSWLLRITLAVILVCCLAIGVLNVMKVRQKIQDLQANLKTQTTARQQAESDLSKARAELASTVLKLKATSASLEDSLSEQQKSASKAIAEYNRAEKLRVDLAQLRIEHEDTSAKLARFEAAGMDPEQVLYASKQLKNFQTQLAAANAHLQELESKLTRLLRERQDMIEPVVLPSDLRAKVVAADPKWHFVVLDAGEKAGVLERGELLLGRGGKLLARARVSRVDAEHCIANVLPGWETKEILEGDTAIPAPRESVASR